MEIAQPTSVGTGSYTRKVNVKAGDGIAFTMVQATAAVWNEFSASVDFYGAQTNTFLQRAYLESYAGERTNTPFNAANEYNAFASQSPVPDPPAGQSMFISPGSYFNIGNTLHTVVNTEITNNISGDCRDILIDFAPKLDVISNETAAITADNPRVIARLTNNKVEAREDSYGRTAVSFDWEQA